MARRKKFGRPLSGVVVVDKHRGETSNSVLQQIKRLFFASKAGHTGSLDPLATGVLPICFGEATKFSQFLLDADKTYLSTFRLGVETDTADADGEIVRSCDVGPLGKAQIEKVIKPYLGAIEQIPPMYSALKKDGQPLYKLARAGVEVERESRTVNIFSFDLLDCRSGVQTVDGSVFQVVDIDVKVSCSKGTYIRTLATDIGRDLGVGAHVIALRRTRSGPFSEEQSYSLDHLKALRGDERAEILDRYLLPVDSAVSALPEVVLDDSSGYYFSQGQAVMNNKVYRLGDEGDKVRVCQESGGFLGIGEITDDGRISPKRLVNA